MIELNARVAATSATFDRFNGKPFVLGTTDCARMVAFHLKQLGHKAPLLKAGAYSTEVGARRALRRLGVQSLSELMDQHYDRWKSPAQARVGDVLCGPGLGGTGDAMAIRLHRDHALGFLDGVCGEVVISDYVAAWKVI
ncbi:DUF6950 family protein [Brevundimonas sp. GN22]